MRILLLPLGSLGDVNPFVGIGLALQRRGHEVVVITNAYFEPALKQAGLNFSSCGSAEAYRELLHHPDAMHPERGLALFGRFCIAATAEAFSRIKQLYRPGSTVMAAAPQAFAARIAQENLGIPLATVTPNLMTLRTAYDTASECQHGGAWLRRWRRRVRLRRSNLKADALLAPAINEFRAQFALKPVRRLWACWRNSPQRVIGLWPEWLYGSQPDWPPNAVVTGFIEYDGVLTTDTPTERDDLIPRDNSERQPIVFTAGSACVDAALFFRAAGEACEILNWPGLLLTQYQESVPKRLPSRVRHILFSPLTKLLPQAAAIVHAGGIGTAARALKAGIPQLIVPAVNDAFVNARLLVHLGVAKVIARRHFTAGVIAARLTEILHSHSILECCAYYAEKMANENALENTCAHIEALDKDPYRPAAGGHLVRTAA